MSTEITADDYDIKILNVDLLKSYKNNPRKNTKETIELVKKSIQQNKFSSVIVVDKNYEIIAGHTRLLAAKELGMTELPVFIAKNLDDNAVKRLRLLDNRLTETTDWDLTKLINELETVKFDDDFATMFEPLMNQDMSDFDLNESDLVDVEPDETYGEPVIQYVMIFDNETQQQDWHLLLIELKERYPEIETHAGRVMQYISENKQ